MLNLDRLDPDWNLATRHGEASKPGLKPEAGEGQKMSNFACKCCFELI